MNREVLAILPNFLGVSDEGPIEFLREFEKNCRLQKRPKGSSEEDFKLRVIFLSLKGEEDAWFRGFEPNVIKTWSYFKLEFLNQFIPT